MERATKERAKRDMGCRTGVATDSPNAARRLVHPSTFRRARFARTSGVSRTLGLEEAAFAEAGAELAVNFEEAGGLDVGADGFGDAASEAAFVDELGQDRGSTFREGAGL